MEGPSRRGGEPEYSFLINVSQPQSALVIDGKAGFVELPGSQPCSHCLPGLLTTLMQPHAPHQGAPLP